MKNYIFKHMNWKILLFSSFLFSLFIIFVLPSVSEYSKEFVGSDSPDSSLFYKGKRLYDIAQSYGEGGRSNYIFLRWTFDVLWPLVYLLFLLSVIVQLSKNFNNKWLSYSFMIPVLATAFDFLENILVTVVMIAFPLKLYYLGTIAGLVTLVKWSFLYFSFAFIGVLVLIRAMGFIYSKKTS